MTHAAACAEIERCAGTQFDARVARALLGLLESETRRADQALAQL
jgi:HD-GYP domain-containing protein (c-di-GMP phosphodiesterase class II)